MPLLPSLLLLLPNRIQGRLPAGCSIFLLSLASDQRRRRHRYDKLTAHVDYERCLSFKVRFLSFLDDDVHHQPNNPKMQQCRRATMATNESSLSSPPTRNTTSDLIRLRHKRFSYPLSLSLSLRIWFLRAESRIDRPTGVGTDGQV